MHFSLKLFVLASACVATSATAAPISWQSAVDTIDPSAVNTTGALVEAVSGSPASGIVVVNGVSFSPSNALLPSNAVNSALEGAQTLDPGLDELLTTMDYGGGTATSITIGGGALVAGQTYAIQVFFTDLRSCCSARVMSFGDGLGSNADVNASGGVGAFGQNATGTFVADGGNQTLSLTTNGFGNAHITAYQIRNAFPAPVIDSFTATPSLIASGESSALSWQITGADSAMISAGVGSVNVDSGASTVSPTATTTYTLTATNGGGSVTAALTVGVDIPLLSPVISEFLASNDTVFPDENEEYPDWIEIHNPNPFAIDLGNHWLSDDVAMPAKWQLPANVPMPGNSYLVVFASGYNRVTEPFHTSFKLSSNAGSYLALIDPDGSTVVDAHPNYPEQFTDYSYGDGGYFSPPTPGAANGSPLAGFVKDTSFDVDRGFYENPITVNITTLTTGATVVYTTDGSEPSPTNGTAALETASVTISSTTILRAAAFKDGLVSTNVDTQTYLFPADILTQTEMDPDVVNNPSYSAEMIPALKSVRSLSIVTDPDNLYDSATGILANKNGRGIAWERPVSIEFIDPDIPADSFQTNAGIRMHGNGSRSSAKNSLRLLFRAEYGAKKLNYPLFGKDWVTQKFNTIVLRAQNANSWTSSRAEDRTATTFLQDTFAKDMQGAMGHPTAGSAFVHLYLNGVYWGMYNPTERPDGSFGEDHFGGDDTDYDAVNRRFTVEVLSGTKTHWDEMIAHSNTLLDTQAEYEQLDDYIDVDNLIDYMLVHQYMQTRDGPDDFGHNNMRLVRRNNPAGPWRAYAWDMEYSMIDTTGTRDYSYPFPAYSSPRSGARDITDSIASVYLRLKDNNPEFQLRYADRAYAHLFNGGALTEQEAAAHFESRATEIESAVVAESARWGDQQRATTPYTRDGEWTTERNRLLNEFFPARPNHVVAQLRIHGLYPSIDPPVFGQHGGAVATGFDLTMTAGSGTVYYTTNGSDPREAWTSTVLGTAYTAPLELQQSVDVKARALDNGEWSALAEATFFVGNLANAGNLVVSEIMYNQPGQAEDLEFVELLNISGVPIDLSLVSFDAGIDFTFPLNTILEAGEYVLIVNNVATFEAAYGTTLPVAGVFQNATALDNSGEPLTLLASDGSVIKDFRYDDKLPWPTATDGDGFTLVLVDPASNPDHALPSNWRSSSTIGGNPGSSDATTFTGTAGADVNQNGIDDLLDYTLGTDAGSALTAGLTGSNITVAYTHRLAAEDVTLHIEWSTNLQSWSPLLPTDFDLTARTQPGGGLERLEFTSRPTVLGANSRLYFRLVVDY